MDSTSSVAGFAAYPPTLRDGLCESAFGQEPQLDPEKSFTQPVASRPVEQQGGDADSDGDDDSALGAVEQRVDGGANRIDDGSEFVSSRAL